MFLIRHPPLPGESLSSWRLRNGVANGYKVFPRPRNSPILSDPDLLPSDDELDWLSKNLNIDIPSIYQLSLNSINAVLSNDNNHSNRKRWVLASGHGSKHKSPGPVACPGCIRTGPSFFHLSWRYAFSTLCPIHNVFMIDTCPECGAKIWPSNLPKASTEIQVQPGNCHKCRAELGKVIPAQVNSLETPVPWAWVSNKRVPDTHLFTKNLPDFFDTIWNVCQLLVRNRSFKIWDNIPSSVTEEFDLLPKEPFQYIESGDIRTRHTVFNIALWMTQGWPNRFVDICRSSRVFKSDILSKSVYAPQRYVDVVNERLALRKRDIIKSTDIEKTINNIRSTGKPISKSSVRRALGVEESKAINSFLDQRRQATPKEFLLFCGAFEENIRTTPTSRDQKATLTRDYLIFLLSVLSEKPIEEICSLSKPDVLSLITPPFSVTNSPTMKVVTGRARQLHIEYEISFSKWSKDEHYNHWFIGRFGDPLAGHTVRDRIAKLIKKCLSGDLWNSADVFLRVMSSHIQHGRRFHRPKFGDIQVEMF